MDVVNTVEARETQGWTQLMDSKASRQAPGGAVVSRETGL